AGEATGRELWRADAASLRRRSRRSKLSDSPGDIGVVETGRPINPDPGVRLVNWRRIASLAVTLGNGRYLLGTPFTTPGGHCRSPPRAAGLEDFQPMASPAERR